MAEDTIAGMTRDDLRRYALGLQSTHDPAQQEGNPYERCEHCHYTRHPCDVFELAQIVLALLDRGRTDDPWEQWPDSAFGPELWMFGGPGSGLLAGYGGTLDLGLREKDHESDA